MKTILELGFRECRGPVGNNRPQLFCAAPTAERESYCPSCRNKYYSGHGKDWRELADMIYALDRSVTKVHPGGTAYPIDANTPVDVKEAA